MFKNKKEIGIYILDIALNAFVIIIFVWIIRTFLVAPFQVSGQSMCNTLNYINNTCVTNNQIGEYMLIDKLSYIFNDPERGDVIVFVPPLSKDEYYVKRIIGVPGDKIQIIDGKVFIKNTDNPEGVYLEENYLNENNKDQTHIDNRLKNYVFEVPENKYFVLGDNRKASSDSRHWVNEKGEMTPFVDKDNIDGKAWVVLWPFQNIRVIKKI